MQVFALNIVILNTAACPSLLYGANRIPLNKGDIGLMESFQSMNVKRFLGLLKRSYHSKLLDALNIHRIVASINFSKVLLFRRSL